MIIDTPTPPPIAEGRRLPPSLMTCRRRPAADAAVVTMSAFIDMFHVRFSSPTPIIAALPSTPRLLPSQDFLDV